MKAQPNSVLFTDNDLRVYAAVRRLKKTRVLELAREVKLAKSTVQGALSRLEQRDLITRTSNGRIPVIRARGANNTLRSLEAQKRRLADRHHAQDQLLLKAINGLKRAEATTGKGKKTRQQTTR